MNSAVTYLLFIGLLLYLSAPLIKLLHAPNTAVVEAYAAQTSYTLDGIIIREETVIPYEGPGAVIVAQNGQTIAAGTPISVRDTKCTLAPTAGLYLQETDGFEHLTPDILSDLSWADLHLLQQSKPVDLLSQGKIISGNGWFLAASIAVSDAEVLQEGQTIILTAQTNVPVSLSAAVIQISPAENGHCAIVFRCIDHLQTTAHLRQLTVTIGTNRTQGLCVPTEAVFSDENGRFVYKLSASRAEKLYITILSQEQDFTILSQDHPAHALHAGDTIIISAPDLKDGMLIKEGTAK